MARLLKPGESVYDDPMYATFRRRRAVWVGGHLLSVCIDDTMPENEIRFRWDRVAKVDQLSEQVESIASTAIAANAIQVAQQWRQVIVDALDREISDTPTAERLADAVVKALSNHVQLTGQND